eukprot:TRINITY_DN783_c0_g1_i1.p1 TRINITY_DN783_c0_g1~~TRINITY_DN783_c0_g1_i1.p1  ORF type:complete len:496 (+),score=102.52 TRINITY_DN783_c0_g1_i1:99-1490(+)
MVSATSIAQASMSGSAFPACKSGVLPTTTWDATATCPPTVQSAWPQQQYIVAVLVPAEQFQSGGFQLQQYPQLPQTQQVALKPTEELSTHGCSSPDDVAYDCVPSFSLPQTTEMMCSGQETEQQEWEQCPNVTSNRLSASAARRQRRKRAAERASNELSNQGARKNAVAAGPIVTPQPKLPHDDLCQELQSLLERGDSKSVMLSTLRGQVWNLARHPVGCRLVQSALEILDQKDGTELAQELQGHVVEAAKSPHANYVLQKVITQLSYSGSRFVAEEISGSSVHLARHRFGCRIFCRLLEFHSSKETTWRLVDELLVEASDLCCHSFGHHVTQSILEHGAQHHRSQLAKVLCSDALGYAQHRSSSYLMETLLEHCSLSDQEALLMQIGHPMIIAQLALTQFGQFVARALLQHPKTDVPSAIAHIGSVKWQLEQTQHGQRFLEQIGLAASPSDFSDMSSEKSQR